MAKYNELLEEYKEEIAALKFLKLKLAVAEKALNGNEDMGSPMNEEEQQDLAEKCNDAQTNYWIECENLTIDIQAEYHDVPFAKSRNQGIEKFWELAGV